MKTPKFQPGFRISATDILAIVCAFVGVFYFYDKHFDIAIIIALSILHFFLFCNTFRIARNLELIWSFIFIVLAYLTTTRVITSWFTTSTISIVTAAILIFIETKKESYHGIFWKTFNPDLESWWKEKTKSD